MRDVFADTSSQGLDGKTVDSRCMFPSPAEEDSPMDPAGTRRRLHTIMDTPSTNRCASTIYAISSRQPPWAAGWLPRPSPSCRATCRQPPRWTPTTHVTATMRAEAAAKIDQGIGKAAPQELPAEPQGKRIMTSLQPYIGKKRKSSTGCISQISEHLWEGYHSPMWPDGKKCSRNVYARTRGECEALLPGLLEKMKEEIKVIKQCGDGDLTAISNSVSKKKKLIAVYMRSTRRPPANAALQER